MAETANGAKKRKRATLEDVLTRVWCYYCERDFDDNLVLTQHQKQKHFRCITCNRRLNTAGGLSVHLQQVHKETLEEVDNAIEGRKDPNIEIFAMNGIPEDIMHAHIQRVTTAFFEMEKEHKERTGNPLSGSGTEHSSKRPKVEVETSEQRKARLDEFRARKRAEKAAKAAGLNIKQEPGSEQEPTIKKEPGIKQEPTDNDHVIATSGPHYDNTNQSLPVSQVSYSFNYGPVRGAPFFGPPVKKFEGVPTAPRAMRRNPFTNERPMYERKMNNRLTNQPAGFSSQQTGFPPPFAGLPAYPPPVQQQQPPFFAPSYGPALHSPMPTAPRHSPRPGPMYTSGNGYASPAEGPPRQNSLPAAPGLPARPSFNLPNLSREEMQRMHEGQGQPAFNNGAQPALHIGAQPTFNTGAQPAFANSPYPTHQPFPQPAALQPAASNPVPDQTVEELIAELKEKEQERQREMQERAATTALTGHEQSTGSLDGAMNKYVDTPTAPAGISTKPQVLPLTKPKKPKGKVKLMYDDNDFSPEEKMAKLSKYAFTRHNGAEYTLSEVGGAVTGTARGENDVVDPAH